MTRSHDRRRHPSRPPAARRDDPAVRASDHDRDAVVDQLRDHATAGRLDAAELEERVGAALSARTRGDLAAALRDLPRLPRRRRRPRGPLGLHPAWSTYVSVMGLLVFLWVATGLGYFWPIWPALGWGLGLVLGGVGRSAHERERGSQPAIQR
jgi:hypothetical protein